MDAHPPVSSRPDEVFCMTDPLYRTPGILPGPWRAISYLRQPEKRGESVQQYLVPLESMIDVFLSST